MKENTPIPVEENGPESGYEKISPTAKYIAHFRSFSDIPYSREISSITKSEEVSDKIIGGDLEVIKRFAPVFEARYKTINYALEKYGNKQIMETAAGLSPRGLLKAQDPEVIYVESDLPELITEKERIISKIVAGNNSTLPDNLFFEAVDITKQQEILKAARHFDKKPATIITEGLLLYLSLQEMEQVSENIKAVLSKQGGGVWLADIVTRQSLEKLFQSSERMRKAIEAVSGMTSRSLENNPFGDENDASDFFDKQGFTVKHFPQELVLDQLASTKKLGISPEAMRPILAPRKIWALEVK